MNDIWQIALAVIGSFGGAGVIILGCSKWLANLTAEKIIKKTEFEYAEKLEKLRKQFEMKNYISNVRFDLEIEIYREIKTLCAKQITDYRWHGPHIVQKQLHANRRNYEEECCNRTRQIDKDTSRLLEYLRTHIAKLDVFDK